jgi:hypothetical protein
VLAGWRQALYGSMPRVRTPKIYWQATQRRVLTMEWIEGVKLTNKVRACRISTEVPGSSWEGQPLPAGILWQVDLAGLLQHTCGTWSCCAVALPWTAWPLCAAAAA